MVIVHTFFYGSNRLKIIAKTQKLRIWAWRMTNEVKTEIISYSLRLWESFKIFRCELRLRNKKRFTQTNHRHPLTVMVWLAVPAAFQSLTAHELTYKEHNFDLKGKIRVYPNDLGMEHGPARDHLDMFKCMWHISLTSWQYDNWWS